MLIVNRQALLDVLTTLRPGIATKDVVEHASSFTFWDSQAWSYNDQVAVGHPLPKGLEIEGAVMADPLLKLLGRLPDETIQIEAGEDELRIQGKKSKAGIPLITGVKSPVEMLSGSTPKWKSLPEGFCRGLDLCYFSASSNMTNPILAFIHVQGRHVESCDNFRLSRFTMKEAIQDELLVPANAVKGLLPINPKSFNLLDGWIQFLGDNDCNFFVRTMGGKEEYPDLSKLIEQDGPELTLPKGLFEALSRVRVFSEQEIAQDEAVDITIKDGHLYLSGSGPYGWLKERMRMESCPKPLQFSANPAMLEDAGKWIEKCVVGASAIKMSGKHFEHVICLIQEKE